MKSKFFSFLHHRGVSMVEGLEASNPQVIKVHNGYTNCKGKAKKKITTSPPGYVSVHNGYHNGVVSS